MKAIFISSDIRKNGEKNRIDYYRGILGGQALRIYIKNKNNFGNFWILIFAIIFIILPIVISAIYGSDTLIAVLGFFIICCLVIIAVMLIKNTFGIKFDRSEGKDKNGKKKKK